MTSNKVIKLGFKACLAGNEYFIVDNEHNALFVNLTTLETFVEGRKTTYLLSKEIELKKLFLA